jgi:hypothetical protein
MNSTNNPNSENQPNNIFKENKIIYIVGVELDKFCKNYKEKYPNNFQISLYHQGEGTCIQMDPYAYTTEKVISELKNMVKAELPNAQLIIKSKNEPKPNFNFLKRKTTDSAREQPPEQAKFIKPENVDDSQVNLLFHMSGNETCQQKFAITLQQKYRDLHISKNRNAVTITGSRPERFKGPEDFEKFLHETANRTNIQIIFSNKNSILDKKIVNDFIKEKKPSLPFLKQQPIPPNKAATKELINNFLTGLKQNRK